MPGVSIPERNKFITLSEQGLSQRAIARLSGRPVSTVNRILQAFRYEQRIGNLPRGSRPKVTTGDEDRMIVAAAVDNPTLTAKEIRNELGLRVSVTTIRERLHEAGLRSRVPARKPMLSADNRHKRLLFAQEHSSWTVADWQNVVFTDESAFTTRWDKRQRIWRADRTRADSSSTTGASASCRPPRGPVFPGHSSEASSGSSGPSSPHQDAPSEEQSCPSDALLFCPPHDPPPRPPNGQQPPPPVKFGELVLLGYNGFLPQGEKGRRRSRFVLQRRPFPNGVKKSKHYVVKTPQSSKAVLDTKQHSISYTLSRTQAVIVEYVLDEETDLFQIGRSSESPIDFVVMDTVAGDKAGGGACRVTQSTISRFACRILVERGRSHRSHIFAAGFDSTRNIFLGEKATKWQHEGEIDGLTTNGVLIMHPQGSFCGGATPGIWMEVSVGGGVYAIRESRSAPKKGVKIEDETNMLRDGSLIDLCGATLLFRSAEGLMKSPTKHHLEERLQELNAGRPQCPVGLNTLVIAARATLSQADKQPYVYLHCGHVQGLHHWGLQDQATNERTCPMCLKVGPVVKLCMGIEPAFYVDSEPPNYAFNPCGHMASEETVKYWASVPIPHGTNGLQSACPFCAVPLEGYPGYVRLIFQDHVD